ncbi:MAG: AlwI family type II restriction endonuclease [Nanoarchaeota archaeon]|nr:AlwI family type II restriction endonuclease [Nanoarchaeota archaeon]
MKQNWSINVTTRNPARLKDMLKVLAKFEGKIFDAKIQVTFIDSAISSGLYKPSKEIGDKALRGRTWVGIFNTLGFAIAYETYGHVVITPAGKNLIQSTEEQESEIFLRQLLKWQLPNPSPTARGFSEYNLIPFIATLKLLKKTGGLSKEEFNLFIPTLTKIENIDQQVQLIAQFRKGLKECSNLKKRAEYIQSFSKEFIRRIYNEELKAELEAISGDSKTLITNLFLNKKRNNLRDYGDTIMRYFRYTQLISLQERKIILSPARKEEINKILQTFEGSALEFKGKTKEECLMNFYDYFGALDKPLLPYEEKVSLVKIALGLQQSLSGLIDELKDIKKEMSYKIEEFPEKELMKFDIPLLKSLIYRLRGQKKELIQIINSEDIKRPEELAKIISVLEDIDSKDTSIADKPLWLEWYTFLALKSLDDEELIKPNFPLDENNEPTSVARPNKPDIEAYYKGYALIPEVSMSARRDQYVQEGIPVIRHVVQIKNNEGKRKVLGIFIAPSIHHDTRNIFFMAAKEAIVEGGQITIIPLTIKQFIEILKIALEVKRKRQIKSLEIINLFDLLDKLRESYKNASEWLSEFDKIISNWAGSLK